MNENELTCQNCKKKIIIYFDYEYDGKRGKCISCGTDFPLTWQKIMILKILINLKKNMKKLIG